MNDNFTTHEAVLSTHL
jgi:hypothetical protein